MRVSFDDAACNRCGDCLRACPEPHVIRFASLKETGRIPAGDCLNCGRCIEACGENALKFRIGPAPGSGLPPIPIKEKTIMIKKLAPLFATLCLLSGATVVQAGDTDIIGAPGIIPHPIGSYLPITAEPQQAASCATRTPWPKDRKAGEIPLTHLKDGKITGDRWNCTLCHAPSMPAETNAKAK
ncbi:MAG: nitrate reductase cytochrome c-type subunit [Sutterella wadsworthensis]